MTPYYIPPTTRFMVWLGELMDAWDPTYLESWRKARRYKHINVLRAMDKTAAIKLAHIIELIRACWGLAGILMIVGVAVFLVFCWRPF